MANMIQYAKEQVSRVIAQAYEKAAAAGALPGGVAVKGTVEIPKDPKNGDYAASFAMAGAKAMKMAPRAIAQALVDHMEKTADHPEGQTVFISHGDCEADAKFVADKIRARFGTKDIYINYVGPVIGNHSGPGTLALFFLGGPR